MLNVILVDNEQTIRHGIKNSIDWQSLDMNVIAEAGDGQTALRLVCDLKPDILITDIKMPYMDGLKLSELALKECPNLKIVLISGFDDFKYAQRGIHLGVAGYLLKPVKKADMEQLLKKVSSTLVSNSIAIEKNNHLKMDVDYLVLEKFFRGIIFGKRHRGETLNIQKQLMGDKRYKFCATIVQLDNYMRIIRDMTADEQSALASEFFKSAEGYFTGIDGVIGMPSEDYTYKLFIYNEDEHELKDAVSRYAMQLKMIMQNSDMSVSMAIGGIYDDAYGLKASFDEAKSALKYRFVMGENSTLYFSNIERTDIASTRECYVFTGANTIMDAVVNGDRKLLRSSIDSVSVDLMAAANMTRAHMSLLVSEIFRRTMDFLETINSSMDEIFENPMRMYSLTIEEHTIRGTADSLYQMLIKVMDYVTLKKQGRFSSYIDQAKRYIEEHYTESDINLEKIAGRIQMSVSYFSLEFKRTVGKTYIEFLTELRIKRAKELLMGTSLKIYNIAEMVGYENPTYFNYLFKQNTGISPGQFRKNERDE